MAENEQANDNATNEGPEPVWRVETANYRMQGGTIETISYRQFMNDLAARRESERRRHPSLDAFLAARPEPVPEPEAPIQNLDPFEPFDAPERIQRERPPKPPPGPVNPGFFEHYL